MPNEQVFVFRDNGFQMPASFHEKRIFYASLKKNHLSEGSGQSIDYLKVIFSAFGTKGDQFPE